jgi:hypothetical protein
MSSTLMLWEGLGSLGIQLDQSKPALLHSPQSHVRASGDPNMTPMCPDGNLFGGIGL